MSKESIDLNPDFKACLHEMERTQNCLFITGKAGTGKSTLLKYWRAHTRKKVVVLAPTGIAALNVEGQTIHSFFGFPPRPLKKEEIKVRRNRRMFQALNTIVIDEISMVRADMIEQIDFFLRVNRGNPAPFGGVQMIFFGDLFQLPPVIASREEKILFQQQYESPYFFSAEVFQELEINMIELREVYRQDNLRFIRLLDAIRLRRIDEDEFNDLNERYQETLEDEDFYVILSARNAEVDKINKQKLEELGTETFSYLAKITGSVSVLPAETPLNLKVGAQVMFLKNDPKKRYVNGTVGMVHDLTANSIKVMILKPNGTVGYIDVEPFEWDVVRHKLNDKNEIETENIGTFTQYPLRLAWAMTIHKSQGKTFDRVIIDMGKGAFEYGQTYVALSRCRTLEGIVLRRPLRPQDIFVDERVVDFYQQHF
ncbi:MULTISPECIES: ATP-dependent RecD-like DNA helicase [unclassified Aureispira]|uniref:ATP-dependent DNA helicase n=1 Tax=unclassified Aureispira TaxID=2649989 RepID=UPI000AD11F73|nr:MULTISPECIES: AAA family ATPase [unclassified Aureispira]WMX13526.1 AAA family ATPase [Aureispira sp. CCB-E]